MKALALLTLLAVGIHGNAIAAAGSAAGLDSDPARSFGQPPAETRILKIIHNWPDESNAQDELRRRLLQQGFGGVVCNVSFDQYLESDAKWQAFVRAVTQAKHAGMALWLYDERGYPSGNAGGLVLRDHPEWEAHGLLVATQMIKSGPVAMDVPPGTLFLAAAFPLQAGKVQLAGKVDLAPHLESGKLRWDPPAGDWQVLIVTESRLYEGTHAEGNLAVHMPYVDLLRPEPTARFIEVTHQRYAQHLGDDLGQYFASTFTDEPSLMSCFLRPMPYRPLPWAPNLPQEFKKRRGYALDQNIIPSLVADTGPACGKHRYDFWLTVGELVSENYFGQIQAWCDRHHVASGGHLLMEESLAAHVLLYGDFFRCARRLTAPSIDCLTSVPGEVPWAIARLLASAAELEGRTLVMSETSDHGQVWRPAGDQRPKRTVSEAEIRGTCNRLIVSGVNAITSYYSFTQLPDGALQRLNEWVGRCCLMLRGGHQVADIAVLYPIESVWTRFTPARQWANDSPAAARIESVYNTAIESLYTAHRDFTVIDSKTLAEARIEGDRLIHRDLSWRVIILPAVNTLPEAAWHNVEQFIAKGGVVIALGDLPDNTDAEFPSPRLQAEVKERFCAARDEVHVTSNSHHGAGVYLPFGSEVLLAPVIDRVLPPDVRVSSTQAPIRVTHRRIGSKEVYFAINDSSKECEVEMDFAAAQPLDHWDPGIAERLSTPAASKMKVRFQAYGARLIRFAEFRPRARQALASGSLPDLHKRALPAAEAKLAHGEFVEGSLGPDDLHSREQKPSWSTRARLRKGQVDTYLFARLSYPDGLDLSQAECLAFDSWVPEGQATPRFLILMLHEKNGGDFIVNTPRSLGASGHERTFVPINRFQLAGWSKDNDGELDLKQIDEVRIGWGGYLGAENEHVNFSFALPEMVLRSH